MPQVVYPVTEAQAAQLRGQQFAPDSFFNPIQDAVGVWFISAEEWNQADKTVWPFLTVLGSEEFVFNRLFVIVASDALAQAFAALDAAVPLPNGAKRDPANPLSVGVGLSVTGSAPFTHYGTTLNITDTDRLELLGSGIAAAPGVKFWKVSYQGSFLESSNDGLEHSALTPWDWQNCLDALGLQQIPQELP
jgi:hypothetical protein